MVKQKAGRRSRYGHGPKKEPSVSERGLDAFRRGDFTGAIEAWQTLPADNTEKNLALAEAYFRCYLSGKTVDQSLADLETARKLAPEDARFAYHLGLAYHRMNRMEEAAAAYADTARLGFSPRRLAPARGLAEVERAPSANLQAYDWLSDQERSRLYPVSLLLQRRPEDLLKSEALLGDRSPQNAPALNLWKGLAEVAVGRIDDALVTLAPPRQVLPLMADAVRVLYYSQALVARDREKEALSQIENVLRRVHFTALNELYASLITRQAEEMIAASQFDEALKLLNTAINILPNSKEIIALLLVILNQQASAAADRREWSQAVEKWLRMHTLLVEFPDLGPSGSNAHNLAIAYEALERWAEAAEWWNTVISLLPRRQTQKPGKHFAPSSYLAAMPVQEAKDWLRKRIILCYQKAGQPEMAIDFYRKAAKQNPADVDLRMGLVNALMANEQWVAARNELKRIIEQDEKYISARVMLAHVLRQDGYEMDAEDELRKALEIDPSAESARKELASLLMERGKNQMDWDPVAALHTLQQVLQYTPEDMLVMAMTGEAFIKTGQPEVGQEWFERLLAKNSVDAYGNVFFAYLDLNDLEGARTLVDRFTQSQVGPKADFFVTAAILCLDKSAQENPSPFSLFSPKPVTPRPDNPWQKFGTEILDTAVEAESEAGKADLLNQIVGELLKTRPEIALKYAEKLVALTPDDAYHLSTLGLLQALNEQDDVGKATLRKAEKLAQKQHDNDLVKHIQELRENISSPAFKVLRSLGPLGNILGGMDEDAMDDMFGDMFDEFSDEDFSF